MNLLNILGKNEPNLYRNHFKYRQLAKSSLSCQSKIEFWSFSMNQMPILVSTIQLARWCRMIYFLEIVWEVYWDRGQNHHAKMKFKMQMPMKMCHLNVSKLRSQFNKYERSELRNSYGLIYSQRTSCDAIFGVRSK